MFNSFVFSQKAKEVNVKQFTDCKGIKNINFDDLRKIKFPNKHSITIILLRAESSHSDGELMIHKLDTFLIPFDTSLIHIFSFELKYTSGSSSCDFKYTVNGKSENLTKGNPPFFCLTTADDSLLKFIKETLNLSYFSKSDKYLLLSRPYGTDHAFYKELNRILYYYDRTFINAYDIKEHKRDSKSIKSNYISIIYSPSILNQVSESGIKKGDAAMTNINLNTLQFSFTNYPKKMKGFGYMVGLGYSEFSASLGLKSGDGIIVDSVGRNVKDKDGELYTKVGYGSDLQENIYINFTSLMAGVSYKPALKSGYLSFNAGIKFSDVVYSSYNAVKGEMSWEGYYNSRLTLSNLDDYEYYKDKPIYKGSKHLDLKNNFVSGLFSIDFGINPIPEINNMYFSFSLFSEISSSMLKANTENQLSSNINNYNSLLYRADKFHVNLWGLKYGLCYLF